MEFYFGTFKTMSMNTAQSDAKRSAQELREKGEVKLATTPPAVTETRSPDVLLHELRVHEIELEMQNEELRHAHLALEQARDRYQSLYEFAPSGYLTLSQEGLITEVNSAGAEMLGEDRKNLYGHALAKYLMPSDADSWHLHFKCSILSKETISCELRLRRSDNRQIVVIVETRRGADTDAPMLSVTLTDITERRRSQTQIERANRALITLSTVNHNLVHADNEAQLLQSICQDIVRLHGYRMGWVGYVQHDEGKSVQVIARTEQEKGYVDWAQLTWAETPRGSGPTGRAIRSGKTQISQDIDHDESFLPWRKHAAELGYASSIALPLIDADSRQVFGVLKLYSDEVNAFFPEEVELLEQTADDLAFGVRAIRTRSERDLSLLKNQQQIEQLRRSLDDTVSAIATLGELRDPYTAGHQKRVAQLAEAIAEHIGLPPEQVHAIYLAGVVHDVGKIQIPAEILCKPGRISDLEYSLIKTHAQAGYEILKGINFPWPIAQMVMQHHERLNGSGYPNGLKGDAILLEARILAVADVVEAMSSHRPYRTGWGIDVALKEVEKGCGKEFAPQIVQACVTLFREKGFCFAT